MTRTGSRSQPLARLVGPVLHLSSNVANVSQRAAITALSGPLDAVHEMRAAFDRRRRTIVGLLSEIPGVLCPVPQGAFYVYPAVGGLLGKQIRGRAMSSSLELAAAVLELAEVAVVPGEAFGTPGFVRLFLRLGRRRPAGRDLIHRRGPRGAS